jgi:hypothetical protein
MPWVVVGGEAGGAFDGGGHDLGGCGKGDVRAHPVAPAGRPEPVRQAMGEPALHAAGGYRDDLRDERVGHRRREDVGEGVGESVRALGPVQVQHGVTDRPRRLGVPEGIGSTSPRRAT